MFKNKSNQQNYEYYENMQLNRIYYELEDLNRKLRNLNNRLRRIEGFLGFSLDEENK